MDREFSDSLPCTIDSLVYHRNHIHAYCKVAQRSFPIHVFRCMAVVDNNNGIAAVDGLAVYALMRMRSAGKHVFDKHRENPFPNPFAFPAVTAENTYSDGIRLNRTQSHEIYYII